MELLIEVVVSRSTMAELRPDLDAALQREFPGGMLQRRWIGEVLELSASYKLRDGSGKVVMQGKAVSRAAYQRFEQIFANVRAQYDAEDRAARTVAETIRTRLAAYLHTV